MQNKSRLSCLLMLFVAAGFLGACQKSISGDTEGGTGTVKFTFRHLVGTAPLHLNNTPYLNPFGESYTVSRFKYYISNVRLGKSGAPTTLVEPESYHLVDHSDPASLSFSFRGPENTFSTISFLVGVDSTRNVSGAQTGALDPLNDMFWTWNSGYIMAKLEGNSAQSAQVGNKFEYHIGGFREANSVLNPVSFFMPAGKTVTLTAGKTSEIFLEADLNKWWQGPHDITISNLPVCTTPGLPARRIADNYAAMFRITNIVNN